MQGFFHELIGLAKPPGGLLVGPLSLIWADDSIETKPAPGCTLSGFGPPGDVVGRTGRDRDRDLHWVLRCGVWNGAHTHQDRNALTLSAFGERLLIDSGRTHACFSPPMTTWHKPTLGHNAILIGGTGQHGSNEAPSHGRILRADSLDGRHTVVGDAKDCYRAASTALRAVHAADGMLAVFDLIEAAATSFTCLWRVDDRDGALRCEHGDGIWRFVRPRASLVIVPVLPPDRTRAYRGWIDHQEDASSCLDCERSTGRFLHLLIPLHPGEALGVELAPGAVRLDLRGRSRSLALLPSGTGFVADGITVDLATYLG
ncbi:MAG: heparinase II/III family protein [Planctomycetes bacterium]|nr:heparinase II/III family protein [Planctomycetota bacterium]